MIQLKQIPINVWHIIAKRNLLSGATLFQLYSASKVRKTLNRDYLSVNAMIGVWIHDTALSARIIFRPGFTAITHVTLAMYVTLFLSLISITVLTFFFLSLTDAIDMIHIIHMCLIYAIAIILVIISLKSFISFSWTEKNWLRMVLLLVALYALFSHHMIPNHAFSASLVIVVLFTRLVMESSVNSPDLQHS